MQAACIDCLFFFDPENIAKGDVFTFLPPANRALVPRVRLFSWPDQRSGMIRSIALLMIREMLASVLKEGDISKERKSR